MKIKQLLLTLLVLGATMLHATPPTWVVNNGAFTYDMTVTAVLNDNCVELKNANNIIGAFVGAELRGTAKTSTIVNGKHLAFFTISSSVATGETVTFKFYDADKDILVDAKSTLLFEEDKVQGTIQAPFSIVTNNLPTKLLLSKDSVLENISVNSLIGNLSVTDLDLGDVYNYSLTLGFLDNASFTNNANSLETNSVFDYETKKQYKIKVRAEDALGCAIEDTFTIKIKDGNDAPTDVSLSKNTIVENLSINTIIGQFSSTDSDINDSFTYQLVSGTGDTDNAKVLLTQNTLRSNAVYDFETQDTLNIRIKTTDALGGSFEKAFEIYVKDANDTPTDIVLSTTSIKENKASGTTLATLSSIDQDAIDSYTYTFVDVFGNNNSSFVIYGNELKTTQVFDYETKKTYLIALKTTDGLGLSFTKQFTISVLDSNDAPTGIALSKLLIEEKKPIGTFVAKITSSDVDANDTFTYNLQAGGIDNSAFVISNDSLLTNTVFDLNAKNTYQILVQTTDNLGLTFKQNFTIEVVNVNDAPIDITLSNQFVNENAASNQLVGSIQTTDADASDSFVYALVTGTGSADNAKFTVAGNVLRAKSVFDFETQDTLFIRLKTTDAFGASFEKAFEIYVKDTNDVPTDIVLSTTSIKENKASGTTLATLSSIDQDAIDSYSYTFVDVFGNNNSSFVIYGNELKTTQVFDYETKKTYLIALKTTDELGLSFTKQFTISVLDSNDAPTGIALSKLLIEEKKPSGTFVAKITTSDVDVNDTFTYNLQAGGIDNSAFVISNDSLLTNAIFDLNAKKTYQILVQTTDDLGLTFKQNFTIEVVNVNDAPTDITLSNQFVNENAASNQLVGSIQTTDADASDSFIYALVTGTGSDDNAKFTIAGNVLRAKSVFDFETQDTLFIRLKTTDAFGASFEKAFEIYVKDTNDVPTDIVLSTKSFNEKLVVGTTVSFLSTVDQDAVDFYTYTLADVFGNNNASFVIYDNELKATEVFDFEKKSSYLVAIKSTDAYGKSVTKQFTLSVLDSNDAPVAITMTNQSINEKSDLSTLVGKLNTRDEDAIDNFTYTFAAGTTSNDNASFIIQNDSILSNTVLDFNIKNDYVIYIQSTDKGGQSTKESFVIKVLDVNVAPTALDLSNLTISENNNQKTKVGIIRTTDEDVAEKFTYQLVKGSGDNDNNLFTATDSSLYTNKVFDFEKETKLSIRLKVTDSKSNTYEQSFELAILDVNEAPKAVDANFSVSENESEGKLIGTIDFLDQDNNQTHTFVLLNPGNAKNPFTLDLQTGELKLGTTKLNYETQSTYKFDVVVSDNGIPSLSDTIQLTINVLDEIEDFLPSSDYVSPNGDGKNDTWSIKNVEIYEDYKLSIFTAYGSEIYHVDREYDNSWDASYKGEKLPSGAYYYIFVSNTDSNKMFKGTISVVK